MSSHDLRQEGGTMFPNRQARLLAACMAVAWVLLIAVARDSRPVANPFECGTDPWDFLHVGEMVELSSLALLVKAHCPNATYSPDGWIELHYGGGRVDVQLRGFNIANATYFQIVSIGGETATQ